VNGNGQRGAVAVLCLVQFVDVLGVTVVITALPVMLADLGADQSAATLVVTGYAMFFGGLLMLGARLGDRYGHRRIMLAGLALFGAASLLGALAGAVVVLAAARCLQGAAAAASVPSALRLLSVVAPAQAARRRAFAAWSAAGAVAGASGFVIGGVLTDAAGWRLLFWLNLPVAVALAAAVLFTVPDRRAGEHDGRPGLDAVGAALLTVAVMGLVVGAALLERPELRLAGAGLLAAGAALMAVFRWVERRVPTPVLPASALRDAHLRPGLAASFLNTATTSSAATLATLYAQQTRGLSAGATFRFYSGNPVNETVGLDANGDRDNTDRPVKGVDDKTRPILSDVDASGMAVRNGIPGTHKTILDMRLSYVHTLSNQRTAGFFLELYNALNHVNFNNVIGVRNASSFGRSVVADAARSMQIGVRYTF